MLRLIINHVMHYCYCTKHLAARKVERERAAFELSNLPRVAKASGEMIPAALEIPASDLNIQDSWVFFETVNLTC